MPVDPIEEVEQHCLCHVGRLCPPFSVTIEDPENVQHLRCNDRVLQ